MEKNTKREIISSKLSDIKLHSAGEKPSRDSICVSSSGKNNIWYPSLHLNTKQVPELKGVNVEDGVTMVIKGKIISHRLNETPGSSHDNYTVEVLKIGVVKEK